MFVCLCVCLLICANIHFSPAATCLLLQQHKAVGPLQYVFMHFYFCVFWFSCVCLFVCVFFSLHKFLFFFSCCLPPAATARDSWAPAMAAPSTCTLETASPLPSSTPGGNHFLLQTKKNLQKSDKNKCCPVRSAHHVWILNYTCHIVIDCQRRTLRSLLSRTSLDSVF